MKKNFSGWGDDDDNDYDAESSSTTTNRPLLQQHSWGPPCQSFCHCYRWRTDVDWTDGV